jgi:F5/8 type C domain-containing protein
MLGGHSFQIRYFHCYIHDSYFFKFSCPTFSTIWQSDPFTGSNTCSKLPVNGITESGTDSINLPSHAIDQNVKTRWSNLGLGSWIQIDVGHENVICDVGINWHRGNERVNTFVISISKDGNAFYQCILRLE